MTVLLISILAFPLAALLSGLVWVIICTVIDNIKFKRRVEICSYNCRHFPPRPSKCEKACLKTCRHVLEKGKQNAVKAVNSA